MFCWTQNVPHIFVICLFTLLLSWVCVIFSESSTYFTELKTFCTGTEHVEVWLMWDHKQQYRIQKNCNRKRKKKAVHHFWFVLYCFNLFQQVLFESLFFCCFFFFSSKDAKIVVHQPLTSYELPSRQQRVWLWYVFWSTVQSLSLFTQWHLALREKLQSMVTALEYL